MISPVDVCDKGHVHLGRNKIVTWLDTLRALYACMGLRSMGVNKRGPGWLLVKSALC